MGRDLTLINCAAFLRASGVGLSGVILGVYLARHGFSPATIGVVVAVGMAGVALGTLGITLFADRLGRRKTLVGLALLSAAGGLGLALSTSTAGILLLTFVGMVNGMGRDRGAAFALDQALVPQGVSQQRRTWVFSWYNIVLDVGHAVGALAAGLPVFLGEWLGLGFEASYLTVFVLYGLLHLGTAVLYACLSPRVEISEPSVVATKFGPGLSPQSRRVIVRLAALFGLDSLGGGFLSGALLAYWFYLRFGVSEATLGTLFFATRILNVISYPIAALLARRLGLLKTMVFTHAPSSLCLIAIPFAPTFTWAVGLLLMREFLVEMDVPTRQSYTVAVVAPRERTIASGVTNLTRNVAWATAPSLAGLFMQHLALSLPLLIGGGLKLVYDTLLYLSFRSVRPPEETVRQ